MVTLLVVLLGPAAHAQSAGIAVVRHAPTLNGAVEGSIQQMTAENTTLNSNASVMGGAARRGQAADVDIEKLRWRYINIRNLTPFSKPT